MVNTWQHISRLTYTTFFFFFFNFLIEPKLTAKQKPLFSTSSQDMLYEGQEYIMMDGNSSYETVVNRNEEITEGEDDDENYEDDTNDLYVPPSNFETTV